MAVPTNMTNASPREMDREATSIAMLNEKTMPMLAKVLSIPEATPNTWGLTALISAAVLAGKKPLAPMPFRTLAPTTTQRPEDRAETVRYPPGKRPDGTAHHVPRYQ